MVKFPILIGAKFVKLGLNISIPLALPPFAAMVPTLVFVKVLITVPSSTRTPKPPPPIDPLLVNPPLIGVIGPVQKPMTLLLDCEAQAAIADSV